MQSGDGSQIVSLGKPSLKARLEAYYSLISPEIVSNLSEWRKKSDQIYQKFGGTYEGERKLASKLAKKYGTAVRLLVAEETCKGQRQGFNEEGIDNAWGEHDESWYQLTPLERGSGDISFVSDRFDPIAAFRESESEVAKQNPWMSESSRLDTVGQFALHLPKGDPQRIETNASRKRTPSAVNQNNDQTKKKVRESHPFESVAESLETGPLSRLHHFRRKRIRVVIRYVNAIRGTLTGTLIAFDKHTNMILRDVEEVYSPRPNDEDYSRSNVEREVERRLKLNGHADAGSDSGWSTRRRQMKNLLVRGDNVVLISKAEEEKEATKSRYSRKTPENVARATST